MMSRVQTAPASSCNTSGQCCGRRATMLQMDKRASGFGPVNQAPVVRKPSLMQKPPERRGSAERRRSLPKVRSETIRETSPQAVYEKLTAEFDQFKGMDLVELESDHMKKMPKTTRDKESLLEECMDLQNAIADQSYHLKLHKVHHVSVNMENRKMECAIEELESSNGLEAPRTGGASRLKAKLQGLKCRQQDYHAILESQRDDLQALKRDSRVAFTQEATVERDVFATETGRLQKMVRRLRFFYKKICSENSEIARLHEKIAELTTLNKETLMRINDTKESIEKMKKKIKRAKDEGEQAKKVAKISSRKLNEFQNHNTILKDILIRKKGEGKYMLIQTRQLQEHKHQVQKDVDNRRKKEALANAKANAKKLKGKKAKKKTKSQKDKDSKADYSMNSEEDIDPNVLATQKACFGEVTSTTNIFFYDALDSRPNSPTTKVGSTKRSEDGDHTDFEGMKDRFTKRVEDAEDSFLSQMEKMEYGKPQKGSRSEGMTIEEKAQIEAQKEKAVETEEKRLVAERARATVELDTKRLEDKAKAAQAEAQRLATDLEALKTMQSAIGTDGKRWQKEKMIVQINNVELQPSKYTSKVQDKGSEIAMNVRITSPPSSSSTEDGKRRAEEDTKQKVEGNAKRRAEEDAKRKMEEDARQKAEEDARRKAKEDAEQKAEEYARQKVEEDVRQRVEEDAKQKVEEDEKRRAEEDVRRKAKEDAEQKDDEDARRKAEEDASRKQIEAIDAKHKADAEAKRKIEEDVRWKLVAEEDAKRRKDEQDEAIRRKMSFDAHKKQMQDDLEATRQKAVEEEEKRKAVEDSAGSTSKFFDPAIQGIIKENIKEVLGHLETVSDTVRQKASSSGTAETAAQDVLKKLD